MNKNIAKTARSVPKDSGNSGGQERKERGISSSSAVFTAAQANCRNRESFKERHVQKPAINGGSRAKRGNDYIYPVEPRVVQIVKKPRTFMNHSYRDFSSVPSVFNEVIPINLSEMSFPQKVHHMLSQPEYSRYISWQPHGRAFRVQIPRMFETQVCPKYLGHTRYSSFLRQLSNHSFKHITQGRDANCYYAEFMLRGLPHLCKYMPKPKDARRLIPDPANEPDFYAISETYPLPDGRLKSQSKEAASLPKAATPRLASDLTQALGEDILPMAKRPRTAPTTSHKTTAKIALPSALSPAANGHAGSVFVNQGPISDYLAANLRAAQTSNLTSMNTSILSAANPAVPVITTAPPVPRSMSQTSLPLGLNWDAAQSPQVQGAVDSNSLLLAAIRAGLTSQVSAAPAPPPAPTPALPAPAPQTVNPAVTLAAVIRQAANNENSNPGNLNSVLASLAVAALGGRL